MAAPVTKPYIKLAGTLVFLGAGIFTLERFGLSQFSGNGQHLQLDGTLLSILVLAPLALVVSGALVFIVGKMRRL